jgi:hypothetical protein
MTNVAAAGDAAVQAAGKVSGPLETTERARGHLYSFHQLTGRADLQLDAAVALLHEFGQADLAERITRLKPPPLNDEPTED